VSDPAQDAVQRVIRSQGRAAAGVTRSAFWEIMAISAFMLGVAGEWAFADFGSQGAWGRFALLFMVGCAAWMAGAAIGFLFGVPRFKSDTASPGPLAMTAAEQNVANFTPNTNLEQISDWLTKIIVGATLVQLAPIATNFNQLCILIGSRTKLDGADIFVGGLLIFLFFAGLLWGYLWCSIRIFREMRDLLQQIVAARRA